MHGGHAKTENSNVNFYYGPIAASGIMPWIVILISNTLDETTKSCVTVSLQTVR
jgi:hypothetical protein